LPDEQTTDSQVEPDIATPGATEAPEVKQEATTPPTASTSGTAEEPPTTEEFLAELGTSMFDTQMLTTSGNITINIPNYDPVVGRAGGTTNTKEGTVTVDF
jgi:hypothetical protein